MIYQHEVNFLKVFKANYVRFHQVARMDDGGIGNLVTNSK